MNKRPLVLTLGVIIAGIALVFSSCQRINESTSLGGNLIPPVDNINTFDTIVNVEAYNDTFGLATDSQYLASSDEHFLGVINNDPIFGKSDARLFLELKPLFYPWTFENEPGPDSLHIDSVVMVLSYIETFGDSTIPQTINVYELDQSNNFTSDSAYQVRKNPFTYSSLLGSATITPRSLDDSVKVFRDSTTNELRVKLNNSFGTRLLNYDTTTNTGAYFSDSLFRTKFKGFAIQSVSGGNALMGIDLDGVNTKLAIYYRANKGGPSILDTTVSYFNFTLLSASANYIKRDYTGTPVAAALGGTSPDPFVYIQSTPGTFATIKIPALPSLSNRVIHRAELIAEQSISNVLTDSMFHEPDYLYIDAYDPSISTFRTIPYDLAYTSSGVLDLGSFGVVPVNALDASGNLIKVWHINLTRYLQHVLTHTLPIYDLRLFAPFTTVEQYGIPSLVSDVAKTVFVNPTIARGRVRLMGSTGPLDNNPHRMRLHIIYSKL